MATIFKVDSPKGKSVEPKNGTNFSLKELQDVVHGYIEIVRLTGNQIMVVNEEGAINGMELNIAATFISGELIHGDVLVCNKEQVK